MTKKIQERETPEDKKPKAGAIVADVPKIRRSKVTFCIKGTMPMIFNRLAEKAKRELLLPSGRKTTADKQANLKHDPIAEFRASVYRHETDAFPTRLYFPPTAFKCVLGTSALDMPNTRKAQVGRLVWIEDTRVNIFGVPRLFMSPVRDSSINRTPDIRTRAIVPEWACMVTITFAEPFVTAPALMNLLDAGGMTCGIGDYRQEKGKASYGQFELVNPDDPDFIRIMEAAGREQQDAGLEAAECYDADSLELLTWYSAEILRRRDAKVAEGLRGDKKATGRRAKNGAGDHAAGVYAA